jgi:hypothetical protein
LKATTFTHRPTCPAAGTSSKCHHPNEELVCVLPPGAAQPVRLTAAEVSDDRADVLDVGIYRG